MGVVVGHELVSSGLNARINNYVLYVALIPLRLPIYRVRISSWISSWIFEMDF